MRKRKGLERSGARHSLGWTFISALLASGCGESSPRPPETAAADTAASKPAAAPTAAAESVLELDGASASEAEGGWTSVARLSPVSAEISLLVDGEGAAHALWTATGDEGSALLHSSGSPSGAARVDTLARGWSSLEAPLLTPSGSTLLAFFAGDSSGTTSPDRIHAAELGPMAAPRRLGVVTAASGRTGPLAGVLDAEGSPVLAWAAGDEARLAFGLTPRHPPASIPACCSAPVELARDADGELVLVGIGAGDDGASLRTLTVVPADDAVFRIPRSAFAAADPTGGRFAMSGLRGAPGVYVAYCAGTDRCEALDLWLHGAADGEPPVRIAEASDSTFVALAPGPEGRLWAVWTTEGGVHAVRARPEGNSVTYGPRIDLGLPASAGAAFALRGAADYGGLRLLLATRTDDGLRLWTRRVQPALSLMPPAMPPPLDEDAVLRLVVEEGGEPIRGAVVRALGQEVRTDARGVAELALSAGVRTDTLEVDVEAAGYAPLHVVFHGERPEGEDR